MQSGRVGGSYRRTRLEEGLLYDISLVDVKEDKSDHEQQNPMSIPGYLYSYVQTVAFVNLPQ